MPSNLALFIHRKVIGRDPICASLHDMGLDLSGNCSTETTYDEVDGNLAVPYGRVSYNSVVDHRSRRPVLYPLRDCVDRYHVWPYWTSRCNPWRRMLKDISIHRPIYKLSKITNYNYNKLQSALKNVTNSVNVSLCMTTWTLIFSASGLPSNGKMNCMDKSLKMRTWRKVNAWPLRDTGFLWFCTECIK